jgi:acyl-coenzyme A thioesterase PaaI-like protein
MRAEADPEFGPIAERIHANVGRQGFMNLVGAELSELSRGTCTIAVARRPELLQQHGFFHGGVTAFLSTTPRRSQRRPRAASRR